MGNSGSGHGGALGDDRPSSPPPGRIRPKVLPDLAPAPRLRLTDNGLILHNGGTISIKKPENPKNAPENHRIEFRRDFYGSEPDLRYTGRLAANFTNNESPSKLRISRTKKKYKAPQVPNTHGDSSSPDSYQEWESGGMDNQPSRRLRLFKTRAETRKKLAEHHLHSLNSGYLPPSGALHRSLSTPQFHAELLEAAEKLRPVREPPVGKASESPSPPLPRRYDYSPREKYYEPSSYVKHVEQNKYHNSNAKSRPDIRPKVEGCTDPESPVSLQEPWRRAGAKSPQPVKTFYFGMSSNEETNEPSVVDKFVAKIQQVPQGSFEGLHGINSDAYSDSVTGDDKIKGEISVQLRATLPRKQLDIPRFSPTTAWRLLSAVEPPQQCEEDEVVQFEQRIFAPPLPIHIPVLVDKSADSGISGDASPQHHDSTHNSQAAWTPQQDLEETSSDGGFPGGPLPHDSCSTAKFSPRFTLSLPRDDRVKLYSFDDKDDEINQPSSLHGLKKLKRSMSGALGKISPPREESVLEDSPLLDSNWVLSRSVPNSLNMTHINMTRWNENGDGIMHDEEDDDMSSSLIKQPSFSYLASGGHVMYLPEYSKPIERANNERSQTFSKSCEDLSSRADLEENTPTSLDITPSVQKIKRVKKFTFQSTVRQIERKRLAAQLSKQAEHKEKERKSELEAMRKVEEEFQKKREREKADIRQQLRLYSITHNSGNPPSPDVLQSTQVLSEFRQQQREYKDYRPHRKQNEGENSPKTDPKSKKAMVHPQVICQIPKSSQMYVTPKLGSQQPSGGFESNDMSTGVGSSRDNYRKNFAQGTFPQSLNEEVDVSPINVGHSAKNSSISKLDKSEPDTVRDIESHIERPKISIGITDLKTVFVPHLPKPLNADEQKRDVLLREDKDSVPLKSVPCMGVNSLQPFMRGKTYRPISFNPRGNNVAQYAT